MPDRNCQRCEDLDSLVVAARSDREAFGRLYESYYERILSYCRRRLYRPSVAEDVCGEAFLYVARKMRTFRGTTDADFRRWVYRVATTEVNAYLRKKKRRQELWKEALRDKRLAVHEAVADDQAHESLDWASVYAAMGRLSARQQAIVALRLFDEMPYEEIAGVLKVRAGTARVTYTRAIKRLQTLLSVDESRPNTPAS